MRPFIPAATVTNQSPGKAPGRREAFGPIVQMTWEWLVSEEGARPRYSFATGAAKWPTRMYATQGDEPARMQDRCPETRMRGLPFPTERAAWTVSPHGHGEGMRCGPWQRIIVGAVSSPAGMSRVEILYKDDPKTRLVSFSNLKNSVKTSGISGWA